MKDDPRVQEILNQAAGLSAAQRTAFVHSTCGGNAELRAEVESRLPALDETNEIPGEPTGAEFDASVIGTSIGPYRLLKKIGEGGMGEVYLAEQDRPVRRRVALKIIKPGMYSGDVVARFEMERQALALMDHSHIARVYDAGTTSAGRPYFAMELVQGVPVTKYCDENRLTAEQRLELFIPICQAVQHAHQKGIIHRDLKPANVLVTVQDGKPVPKVIDFGIAKTIEQRSAEMSAFTQFGMMVGTPEYMSPEQAGGDSREIDTRSDVYALGVILYELLTGETPIDRRQLRVAGYQQMMQAIREIEPAKPSLRLSSLGDGVASASALRRVEPRKLARLLAGDLDVIVMKCLEKNRSRRYETASGLARDIERYLNHDPVEASGPSAIYILGKFGWKYRKPVAVGAAFAFLLVAFLVTTSVVFWVLKREASRQRDEAAHQRDAAVVAQSAAETARRAESAAKEQAVKDQHAAEEARAGAERETYLACLSAAGQAVNSDNYSDAASFLNNAPQRLRNWEWNYLHAVTNPQTIILQMKSLDRSFYLADRSEIVALEGDKSVHYFDARTGHERRTLQALKEKRLRPFAISPDGKRFIAERSTDLSIVVLDENGEELVSIPKAAQSLTYVYTTIFTRDHSRFITVARDDPGIKPPQTDHPVRVWETATGRELLKLDVQNSQIVSVNLSSDESKLVTGSSWDGVSKVWDLSTGKCLSTYRAPEGGWIASAFSPDSTRVVSSTASLKRQGVIWDATAAVGVEKVSLIEGFHANSNICADFSPDGKLVALSGGKYASIFNADTGALVTRLRGHLGRVPGVRFIDDGSRVMTTANDNSVRIWDLQRGPQYFGDKTHLIIDAQLSTDGNSLVAYSVNPSGRVSTSIYDVASKSLRRTLDPGAVNAGDLHTAGSKPFDPGLPRTAVPAADGTLYVFNSTTGELISKFGVPLPGASPVTGFTHDGQRAVTGSAYGTAQVWDLATGQATATLRIAGERVDRIIISPLDDRAITVSRTGNGDLWDLRSDKLIGTIPGSSHIFGFSHDGKRIVAGQGAATLMFNAATARQESRLFSHNAGVESAAFSPDDSKLVICYTDEIAEIWDMATLKQLRMLYGHHGSLLGAGYSPDGSRIVTCSLDNTAQVWDADRGDELLTLQGHTGPVQRAEFSTDGTKIMTISADGTARVWDSAAQVGK